MLVFSCRVASIFQAQRNGGQEIGIRNIPSRAGDEQTIYAYRCDRPCRFVEMCSARLAVGRLVRPWSFPRFGFTPIKKVFFVRRLSFCQSISKIVIRGRRTALILSCPIRAYSNRTSERGVQGGVRINSVMNRRGERMTMVILQGE